MSLLFRIVYAAHARGTHHKLALDSLWSLQLADAELWRRLFLKHVDRYMAGAKAPDDTFKDFKNHVLHVGDGYWGGAPEAALLWYDKTVAALKDQRWDDAVYAAGVTSHYCTDPIMPFHTGQTEAENAFHRATEWSISRSYDGLRELAEARFAGLVVAVPAGPDWLGQMVCNGAEVAHKHYETLLAHYDIHRGLKDPAAGLDGVGRSVAAELLFYAAAGYARILARALIESEARPPVVDLTMATVMAAVRIPAKVLAKRLSNAADRAVVAAMYAELKATGRVDRTLPEDDRAVRDLHAREVLAPRWARQAAERARRLTVVAAPATPVEAAAPVAPTQPIVVVPAASPVDTAAAPAAPIKAATPPPADASSTAGSSGAGATAAATANAMAAVLASFPAQATSVPSISRLASTGSGEQPRRIHLRGADALDAAPSIGPKMAERFAPLGVKTVAAFLDADPAKLSARLADRRITGAMVDEWQCQARLVMAIAGLRGTHAQLVTGAGYRTPAALAAADPAKLCADVLRFGASPDGRRILREGGPPDVEKIKAWVDLARVAMAA